VLQSVEFGEPAGTRASHRAACCYWRPPHRAVHARHPSAVPWFGGSTCAARHLLPPHTSCGDLSSAAGQGPSRHAKSDKSEQGVCFHILESTTVGFLWTPSRDLRSDLSTLENVVAGYGCIGYVRIADLVFTTAVQFTADQTAGLTTGKKRNFQLFQPVVMSACVECHAGTREV
jgi:hypothetical protein